MVQSTSALRMSDLVTLPSCVSVACFSVVDDVEPEVPWEGGEDDSQGTAQCFEVEGAADGRVKKTPIPPTSPSVLARFFLCFFPERNNDILKIFLSRTREREREREGGGGNRV